MRIFGNQKIVTTTLPTTGFRDFILWDGHCATSRFGGHMALFWYHAGYRITRQYGSFRRVLSHKFRTVEKGTERGGVHTLNTTRRKVF